MANRLRRAESAPSLEPQRRVAHVAVAETPINAPPARVWSALTDPVDAAVIAANRALAARGYSPDEACVEPADDAAPGHRRLIGPMLAHVQIDPCPAAPSRVAHARTASARPGPRPVRPGLTGEVSRVVTSMCTPTYLARVNKE